MNDINRIFNQVLPSPPDDRDYRAFMAMDIASDSSIPETFEVWQPPIENQGSTGNCVAQSLANLMECIDHKDGLNHKDRSVGYIYGTVKTTGMYPREACESLCKEGDVYRSVWEYLDENPECWLARQNVAQNIRDTAKKPLMYVRMTDKEEMQNFMLKYDLPVLIVADAQEFTTWAMGRHAVVARGWRTPAQFAGDKRDIKYTNSWGATWGEKSDGTGWIKFENIQEIWGIVPMEQVKFTDVSETRWSKPAIDIAVADGIMQGYPDGTFRPDQPLTREEYAAVYARMKAVLGIK